MVEREASDELKTDDRPKKMFALLGAAGAAALFPTVGNAAPEQQAGHHPTVAKSR
jgi:hypothetical protein